MTGPGAIIGLLAFWQVETIWPPLLLFVLGVVFMLAEVFIPSHGILSILAGLSILCSLVMAANLSAWAFLGLLLLVLVAVPAAIVFLLRIWPYTYSGKRLFLHKPEPDATQSHSKAAGMDLERLMGQIGRTITPLRPSGLTELDAKRIDTVSEGMMIDAGQLVQVLSVHGNRVVVRQLDDDEIDTLDEAGPSQAASSDS